MKKGKRKRVELQGAEHPTRNRRVRRRFIENVKILLARVSAFVAKKGTNRTFSFKRFLIDTGFNSFLFMGVQQYRWFQQKCSKYGIGVHLERVRFDAKTAGG